MQRPGQAARLHVGGGVQRPQEVLPRRHARLKHVGAGRLGVPPLPDVGQPAQKRHPAVLPQAHVSEIRQMALPRLRNGVQGTENGKREAGVGQPVLAAPHHVDAVAQLVGVPLLQAAHQRRQPRGMDVGLVGSAAEAGFEGRGVGVLQGSLRAPGSGPETPGAPGPRGRTHRFPAPRAPRRACTARPALPGSAPCSAATPAALSGAA